MNVDVITCAVEPPFFFFFAGVKKRMRTEMSGCYNKKLHLLLHH